MCQEKSATGGTWETVEVAPALPLEGTLTYRVPAGVLRRPVIGMRVLVPLRSRTVTGYVLGPGESSTPGPLKEITDLPDDMPLFPAEMIPFFRWLSDYYLHPIGEVIKTALPAGVTIHDKTALPAARGITERVAVISGEIESRRRLSDKQAEIVGFLRENPRYPLAALRSRFSPSAISSLRKKGIVTIEERAVHRDPLGETVRPSTPPEPTPEQQAALNCIIPAVGGGFQTFLLAGVTGSGKTEVYLRLTEATLNLGFSVIVLVPEIGLITQTARRFHARFGNRVAVLHSGLSPNERLHQWMRVLEGEADVVMGARSALFAPLAEPGLIIVDEEHDEAYKQESGLRYHARDAATMRAMLARAVAVLGSATPSIQSTWNADIGKAIRVSLNKRVAERAFPEITVVDLTKVRDTRRGIGRVLTPELTGAAADTLARGEQVLLFLNRRGYAGFPVCAACGMPLQCERCAVSMTYHLSDDAYLCHYCNRRKTADTACPVCASKHIMRLGFGTQTIEEGMAGFFPDARIARLDRDTAARKGAFVSTLKALKAGEIDILVGTQMIAKGHDFPNITLAGIICADLSLNIPDFRSAERTFQLIAQVAGRSGRGDRPGRVILQTFNPTHFAVRAAQKMDYQTFYKTEIEYRKRLNYPPVSRAAMLRFSGKKDADVRETADRVGGGVERLRTGRTEFEENIEILGPAVSPLSKIDGRHRRQLLIKCRGAKRLGEFLRQIQGGLAAAGINRGVRVRVDVDPYQMS
jgi:primosomal protein N' (replication factor Y)